MSRAPRNRTLTCTPDELLAFCKELVVVDSPMRLDEVKDRVINQDMFIAITHLPLSCVDLLILDPPYNISKNYHGHLFKEREKSDYRDWFASVIATLKPVLKPTATIYVCSDWRTSVIIAPTLEQEFFVRNRITWEREKGRGASANWKNNTEDIWFCSLSDTYTFNVDAVKLKRKVIAPYRTDDGQPKDWEEGVAGNFRLTYPSNIWTDITIPFWSMPENTDHPTQKPEKLIAKLILASSHAGGIVLDPFLGSGTTAVVAKKLGRHFVGIEANMEYCCWALKRIGLIKEMPLIQGYADGVFWERNSLSEQPKTNLSNSSQKDLFL